MTNENYKMMCLFVRNGFRSVLEIHISHASSSSRILSSSFSTFIDCHASRLPHFSAYKKMKSEINL